MRVFRYKEVHVSMFMNIRNIHWSLISHHTETNLAIIIIIIIIMSDLWSSGGSAKLH